MEDFIESLYISSDLGGRIELARYAYRVADENRGYGGAHSIYGPYGSQFCRLLGEFIGEMTDESWDEDARLAMSEDLYKTAWEYYEVYAPLLDGGELA